MLLSAAVFFGPSAVAQDGDLEFKLDVRADTILLPPVLRPGIDVSGRGYHRIPTWPQTVAAPEALAAWQKDIGFGNIYRLQYSLWEIGELAKDKDAQTKLLANYEQIIRQINEAGGVVILDIFGIPAGMGKVLNKKSAPGDIKAFKQLIKGHIWYLSCEKKLNVWYEVWSAPDVDDFFLGRKQEYLNLYRAVAEAVQELRQETKLFIPVGGPSTSWWFQNLDGNSVITPERSLIYDLIRFCYNYRLPLDFISWHGYTTDPLADREMTVYNKSAVSLVRDWLSYFRFNRETPLVVDEWNYDRGANVLPERSDKAYIAASYILARLRNMYEVGIDRQLYFCLEDFRTLRENVVRDVGALWFDSERGEYSGGPKAMYVVFRMLAGLTTQAFFPSAKMNDDFVSIIAAKSEDRLTLLVGNYIDPDMGRNYLSRNISALPESFRKSILLLAKDGRLDRILKGEMEIATLRLHPRLKTILKKALELQRRAELYAKTERPLKVSIKNLQGQYLYQRYCVDASCGSSCNFVPVEEKEIETTDLYEGTLSVKPYSVQMIVFSKKPKEASAPEAPVPNTEPAAGKPADAAGAK